MLTMGQLKKWITDTLIADVKYSALCVTTVGSVLNYYRSSPIDRVVEVTPFLTVFSNESNQDFNGGSEFNRTWEIPIALGIVSDDHHVLDGVVKNWNSTDKVEILSANAIETLRKEARCGIYGFDVKILTTRVVVTEIGEADDVQANIFLTFGEINNI